MSMAKIMGCASETNKRHSDDFYNTPTWVVNQVLEVEQPPQQIWEPCSGSGAIVRVLKQHGFKVVDADINPRNGQPRQDFFSVRERGAPAILTNPPFALATKWIVHCYQLGVDYVALLMKADVLHTDNKRKLLDTVGHPTRIWGITARIDFLDQGAGTTNFSWFVWDGWHATSSTYKVLRCPPAHLRDAASTLGYDDEPAVRSSLQGNLFKSNKGAGPEGRPKLHKTAGPAKPRLVNRQANATNREAPAHDR
jgi:hypothetical protein